MIRRDGARGRGYCGVGVLNPKTAENVGTLWRSAVCFEADFIFTIGQRFPKQPSDTVKSWRHIPCFEYDTVDDWLRHLPVGSVPVGVEITDDAIPLETFAHPPAGVYLLGPEDGGLSAKAKAACVTVVQIDTCLCLNVAVAGSLLLYDRNLKAGLRSERRWGPRAAPVEGPLVGRPEGCPGCQDGSRRLEEHYSDCHVWPIARA